MNELELLYQDPRVRAILGVIRDAEGTSKYGDAYRVAGGGKITLGDLRQPQFHRWGFRDKSGNGNVSSATGAYQFLQGTWDGLARNYGFRDFSPYSQDLAAIALLKESGAIPYILRGDYFGGLNAARKVWASLPGAGYNQQERDYGFLKQSLEKHLGHPVAMHQQSYTDTQIQQQSGGDTEITNYNVDDVDPFAKLFNVENQETTYNNQTTEPIEIASWNIDTPSEPEQPEPVYDMWGNLVDNRNIPAF